MIYFSMHQFEFLCCGLKSLEVWREEEEGYFGVLNTGIGEGYLAVLVSIICDRRHFQASGERHTIGNWADTVGPLSHVLYHSNILNTGKGLGGREFYKSMPDYGSCDDPNYQTAQIALHQ